MIFLLEQSAVLTPGCYRRMIINADSEGDARTEATMYATAKSDASAPAWNGATGVSVTTLDPEDHLGIVLSTTEAG